MWKNNAIAVEITLTLPLTLIEADFYFVFFCKLLVKYQFMDNINRNQNVILKKFTTFLKLKFIKILRYDVFNFWLQPEQEC